MRSSIRILYLITCYVLIAGCSSTLKLSSTVVTEVDSDSLKVVRGLEVKVIDRVERVVGVDTTDVDGDFLIELTDYDREGEYTLVIAESLLVEASSYPLDLTSGENPLSPRIKVSVLGAVRGVVQDRKDTTRAIPGCSYPYTGWGRYR